MKDTINIMIMTAMKGGTPKQIFGMTNDEIENADNANILNALKQIKCEFVNSEKSGKDVDEIAILNKLKKQHEDAIRIYEANNRQDLVKSERDELSVIKICLPEVPTYEKVLSYVQDCINEIKTNHTPTMRDMGFIMKCLKADYKNVDGKMASEIIKSELSK